MQVPAGVVGIRRGTGVRTDLLLQIVERVIGIARDIASGVRHRDELIERVVAVPGLTGERIGDFRQPVELVVGLRGAAEDRCIDFSLIAVGVVAEAGRDGSRAGGADVLPQLIERVEDTRAGLRQRVGGIVTSGESIG